MAGRWSSRPGMDFRMAVLVLVESPWLARRYIEEWERIYVQSERPMRCER